MICRFIVTKKRMNLRQWSGVHSASAALRHTKPQAQGHAHSTRQSSWERKSRQRQHTAGRAALRQPGGPPVQQQDGPEHGDVKHREEGGGEAHEQRLEAAPPAPGKHTTGRRGKHCLEAGCRARLRHWRGSQAAGLPSKPTRCKGAACGAAASPGHAGRRPAPKCCQLEAWPHSKAANGLHPGAGPVFRGEPSMVTSALQQAGSPEGQINRGLLGLTRT